MKKSLVLLLCLSLMGCVHYTPRERAAISGIRRGDRTILRTMSNEELDTLEAKLIEEQSWVNAFSTGARGMGEGTVSALRETADMTPKTPIPQQQYTPIYQPSPSFSDGYRDGYRDGYQYAEGGGINPIAPILSILPIPNIGETTYQDGYTRGIIDGQRQRKAEDFNKIY